jgi:hypothetical protein
VDGRTIEPQWLRDAAETYDKNKFTALIWPDHQRWFNMGSVEALQAKDNDQGGVDLFAQLAPNDFYLQINANGQRLFTSIEIQEDFLDSGKAYLIGLGATDSPASSATTEVRFSRIKETGVLLGEHTENTTHEFDDENAPGERALTRLFASILTTIKGDDMKKATAEQLQAQIDSLAAQFKQALPGTPAADDPADPAVDNALDQRFTQMEAAIAELKTQIAEFTSGDDSDNTDQTVSIATFTELQNSFNELAKQFKDALQEQPGTDAGEHISDDDDLSAYV